jgi:hypothetical protein
VTRRYARFPGHWQNHPARGARRSRACLRYVEDDGLPWHYVLRAENVVQEWQGKRARLGELPE